MDFSWWERFLPEVSRGFSGRLVTTSRQARKLGIKSLPAEFIHYGNSGAAAVSWVIGMGAERVLLLGYDCQLAGDRVHWHGDHPPGLGNAGAMSLWPQQFADLAASTGRRVLNCSRSTALSCFEKMDLEKALELDSAG